MVLLEEDRKEFEKLAAPVMTGLRASAIRLTNRNRRDAEDLVQDALTRACQYFHKFDKDTNFKAWIHKIQTNLAYDGYELRVKERAALSGKNQISVISRFFPNYKEGISVSPESIFFETIVDGSILDAVKSLPNMHRTAFILVVVHELSYKEAAKIIGCPQGTVMSRLFRARKLLRESLTDYAREQGIMEKS